MSVFEDCTRSTESSPSEGDTTFDLMFLRIGIHGDALTVRCNVRLSMVVGSSTSSANSLYITLVFFRFLLSPTSRLAWLSLCSISWSSSILLAKIIIPLANRRWLRYSLSILIPLFSHRSLRNTFSKKAMNSLRELVSSCRTPLRSLNHLESCGIWCRIWRTFRCVVERWRRLVRPLAP